jgi:RNA polymerase sigma-70 factor (sigma-E family)
VVADADGFDAFVRTQSRGLLRAGWLLTGDWATAEDLVQASLAAVWQRWAKPDPLVVPVAYARQVMITTFLRWRRRRWTREVPTAELPDHPAAGDGAAEADLRDVLVRALQALPQRQRAVVVLRYFDDLSERETAVALNCSVGSVKTHASRAMARLRTDPGLRDLFGEEAMR